MTVSGIVVLLLAGGAAAIAVDLLEVTAPQLPYGEPCAPGPWNSFFAPPESDPAECLWHQAMNGPFTRVVRLQVSETKTGGFQAVATVTASADDPLVTRVQRGDARRHANTFAGVAVGFMDAGRDPFAWSAPVVARNDPAKTALISMTGKPLDQSNAPRGTRAVELHVFPPSQGTLDQGTIELSTRRRVIAGVQGDAGVTSQTAHSLTASRGSRQLTISLQPSSPQPFTVSPGPAAPGWLARVGTSAWHIVSGFAVALLAAAAWIAVLIASRMGAFGVVGWGPAWRRMEQVLGAVIVAHLVILAAIQISNMEGNLPSSLWNKLSHAIDDSYPWTPTGYPRVAGGLILLIAFAVCAAAWSPRSSQRSTARRGAAGAVMAAAAVLVTVGGYAFLVLRNPGWRNGGFVLAAEVPVAVLCALVSLAVLAAWVYGGLPSVFALSNGPSPAVERAFSRRRIAAAVVAAGVLTGLGTAAAILNRGSPLSLDDIMLWVAAAFAMIVTLVVVVALLVARFLPRLRPRYALACAAVAAIIVAFAPIYLPYVLITKFTNGHAAYLSGTFLFAALLTLAAVLAFGAWTASRPWRRTSSVVWISLIVAVAAVLSVAATLTNYGGYGPLFLRWGVVIVAGAAIGTAAVRLAAVATGPLSPSAYRTPHLLAIFLIAAAIAVPWGQLRGGIPADWWTLESYALRIDGVLALALVAAGVTALRRIGLMPCRHEGRLRAHRALGIAAWLVALSGSYTFAGGGGVSAAAAIAAAALAAWLLMPARQVLHATCVLNQTEQQVAEAVKNTLRAGAARRTLPGLSKAMREKVAAGTKPFPAAQKKIEALEEQASGAAEARKMGGHAVRVTAEERGFGALTSARPWQRARWGLGCAVIAGAPWVLLGLAGVSLHVAPPEGYPELALASAVAPLVLRWAGYGLLFGYFFPLLRGTTGLSKSIWFFAAAVVPSLISTLTSAHPTAKQWHSAALLLIQLFIFAMTMGILADLAVLREHGFAAGRLIDLHSFWTVSAWASSVALAIGTGIATIILAGLQPFVIGVITPSSPAPPPPATSGTMPGAGG